MKKINVKIVYRNYKPLHENYFSFRYLPPEGVNFIIPEPKKNLRKLYPIYDKYGDNFIIKGLIKIAQRIFFERNSGLTNEKDAIDIYHYAHMLPSRIPDRPFVVDLEHATAFSNFVDVKEKDKQHILEILSSDKCIGIVPFTIASNNSLQNLLGKEYKKIASKVSVIYPSLPCFYDLYKDQADYSLIKNRKHLNILFVGNDPYRKGLHELLTAFTELAKKYDDIDFYAVLNVPEELKIKYNHERIFYIKPQFSKEEIVKKLFIPCDVFIMPTHSDTFGMVYLDALASGTPVIGTNQFAGPELIKDKVNGLIVKTQKRYLDQDTFPNKKSINEFMLNIRESVEQELVDDLMEKIEYLYKNPEALKKMSMNALRDFKNHGKFALETRNSELLKIYKKGLKNK